MKKGKQFKKQETAERSEDQKNLQMLQGVVITFKDGTIANFTGPAVVFEGEERVISDVKFTPPRPLPPEFSWGKI